MAEQQRISCLIVDDDPLALTILSKYVSRVQFLKLEACCKNAFEALDAINAVNLPVIFLDIRMPELSGLELARIINDDAIIVFTSAYGEYAVESFKVNAVDFLLKPVSEDDFQCSALRAKERYELYKRKISGDYFSWIYARSGYKQVRIAYDEILCFEGIGDYVNIWTSGRKEVLRVNRSLGNLEDDLPESRFMRVHRSYIIALDKIKMIERNRVILQNGLKITISDSYKDNFRNYIGELRS
jgi:DNA-binding LytR/AlgR family response regulator